MAEILPVLSNPLFKRYILGNGMSLLGLWVQRVGLGWLTWEATLNRDFYVIMSVTLLLAILIRFFLLLHELINWHLDPRMRS